MKDKINLHLLSLAISICFLIFSGIATWYEGSNLLNRSFEWDSSAPFSNMVNDKVESEEDVLQIDFFVYAGKFYPLFPSIMLISLISLIFTIGTIVFKNDKSQFGFLMGFSGFLFILLLLATFQHITSKYYYVGILAVSFLLINLLAYQKYKRTSIT